MTFAKKKEIMEIFISVFAALFSVINPLGTVPVFVGLTTTDSPQSRNRTSLMTSINVFIILIISFFAGSYVLEFFNISIDSLRIAGGLIITSSGFALLTGSFTKHKGMKKESVQADLQKRNSISLTPLAIPMLAGPGSISLLITLRKTYVGFEEILWILAAVVVLSLSVFFILRSAHFIVKGLGASGINAVSRIIGFIVIAIGIEYVSRGVEGSLTLMLNK